MKAINKRIEQSRVKLFLRLFITISPYPFGRWLGLRPASNEPAINVSINGRAGDCEAARRPRRG
jgi:hypothetical protein